MSSNRANFSSITKLFDADSEHPLDAEHFDDSLWTLLCDRISSPRDLIPYEDPVAVYYASRYMQWEVGNGGFAQAAYNIPHWFELAAEAYLELGKPKAVALIRDAIALLPGELGALRQKDLLNDASIERIFAHFRESEMAALDDRIPGDEWWIDDLRVAYARKHAEAFRKVS